MLVTEQLTVAIDYHSMDKNPMEVNGYRQPFDYQHSSKYIFGFNLRVSKWWQNFHFWMNYPFNVSIYFVIYLDVNYNMFICDKPSYYFECFIEDLLYFVQVSFWSYNSSLL